MDRVLENLHASRRLNYNVKPIRVLTLQLLELRSWVFPRQLYILVCSVERFREIHLQTLWRGYDDVAPAIQTQHLGQHEPRGASTEHEHGGAHFWCDFVQPMGGARGRLEEGGVDIGEILDLEDAASCYLSEGVGGDGFECQGLTRISTVLGKAAVHGDAMGFKVLAK